MATKTNLKTFQTAAFHLTRQKPILRKSHQQVPTRIKETYIKYFSKNSFRNNKHSVRYATIATHSLFLLFHTNKCKRPAVFYPNFKIHIKHPQNYKKIAFYRLFTFVVRFFFYTRGKKTYSPKYDRLSKKEVKLITKCSCVVGISQKNFASGRKRRWCINFCRRLMF